MQTGATTKKSSNSDLPIFEIDDSFHQLIKFLPDAIIVHDGDQIIFCNDAAVRIHGANTADELIGLRPNKLVHPDEIKMLEERRNLTRKPGATSPLSEFKRMRLDGTSFWGETTAVGSLFENRPAFVVLTRDITERKASEAALRESEKRHKNLFESSEVSIWNEDYTNVCDALRKLRLEGVVNFRQYLEANEQVAWEIAAGR